MPLDLQHVHWRKSSRSNTGGNCIEVAPVPLAWHKSSHSQTGGNCVEVADAGAAIAVRDSKDPAGAVLTVTPTAWATFTEAVHRNSLR